MIPITTLRDSCLLQQPIRTRRHIQKNGYVKLPTRQFDLNYEQKVGLEKLRLSFYSMPRDPHLFEGEGERFRRYGRYYFHPAKRELKLLPHTPFFQDKKFDDLYGDIHRQFPPMTRELRDNEFLNRLLVSNFYCFPIEERMKKEAWEISLHMIRIVASKQSKTGRPAPEGIHQDGYHYGAIHLMERRNLEGAENRIYDLKKQIRDRSYLQKPMDSLLLDDRSIFHGVEPFHARDPRGNGERHMLILLYQPLAESPQPKISF